MHLFIYASIRFLLWSKMCKQIVHLARLQTGSTAICPTEERWLAHSHARALACLLASPHSRKSGRKGGVWWTRLHSRTLLVHMAAVFVWCKLCTRTQFSPFPQQMHFPCTLDAFSKFFQCTSRTRSLSLSLMLVLYILKTVYLPIQREWIWLLALPQHPLTLPLFLQLLPSQHPPHTHYLLTIIRVSERKHGRNETFQCKLSGSLPASSGSMDQGPSGASSGYLARLRQRLPVHTHRTDPLGQKGVCFSKRPHSTLPYTSSLTYHHTTTTTKKPNWPCALWTNLFGPASSRLVEKSPLSPGSGLTFNEHRGVCAFETHWPDGAV